MIQSFRPGQPWLDNNNALIQAHGGSIFYADGVYYWYGENKDNYRADGKNWHNGVRCYSSADLYNWKDEGSILPASDNPANPMYTPYIEWRDEWKLEEYQVDPGPKQWWEG